MKKILLLLCALLCCMAANAHQMNLCSVIPDEDTLIVPDVEASFPGGLDSMYAYLKANIIPPTEAKEKGITGKVIVQFVVEKDGSVSNVKLMRDIGSGCGEEVVRVVKAMPKWTPAMKDDKPLRWYFALPVSFSFNSPKDSEDAHIDDPTN